MCKESTMVKFCTCSPDVTERDHYWVLHRRTPELGMLIIGEMLLPIDVEYRVDLYNREVLLSRVNDPAAWDADLRPLEGDRLQLTFTCVRGGESTPLHYGFEFSGGAWVECEFEHFDWMTTHEELKTGEITLPSDTSNNP